MPDFQAIAEKFRHYASVCLAYADTFPEHRVNFTRQAERWLQDVRRVEQNAALIAQSWEALTRVDALLSTRPAVRRERTIPVGVLSQAM